MRAGPTFNRDLIAGLVFAAWGLAGLWLGRELPLGVALRMGPGYVPWLLSWALVLIGSVIAIKGAVLGGEAITPWNLRPLILLPLALLTFAVLIEPAGLPLATVAVVIAGAVAGPEFRPGEVAVLALGLAVCSVGLFVYGLGLPLTVWPF
jgi:putative tricarboxylic transport membrane protein